MCLALFKILYMNSLILPRTLLSLSLFLPILKLRGRVKQLAQGHTAARWWREDFNKAIRS